MDKAGQAVSSLADRGLSAADDPEAGRRDKEQRTKCHERQPPSRGPLGDARGQGGLVVTWIPWQWWRTVQRVPMIHDITTDTENPPVFVAILPLRAGASNTAEYGGPEIDAQQRAGYPDLGPLTLPVPPAQAFTRALTVAREMGWEIVASDAKEGRIEVTATTFWFGFKDDMVIRVTPSGNGSRIDVRSVSRVGRGDVGANAKRITDYLSRLARVESS